MKATRWLILFAALAATDVSAADDTAARHDFQSSPAAQTPWNTDPRYWERALREPKEYRDLKIGRSDYVIRGPLVDSVRRRRATSNESPGRRFLRLPIVRLFVPQPMPEPPGGGRYFLWGESSRPWSALAEGAAAGELSDEVRHEARPLFWIGR